jgi:alkylhydroperoxidase/carboxymuconolactone decarboxylase family protein YurZ
MSRSALAVSVSSIVHAQQKNSGEPSLTSKQEAIVPISAYAAKGDQVNLKSALGKGLEAGLTINEIKEVLVQLYAYAGFPRSLNAINTFQIFFVGKFTSDAITVHMGKYVSENAESIIEGGLSW